MDCLVGLDFMIEQGLKVDAIITDIPQQITRNDWDKAIPLGQMWEKLYKVRKNKHVPIVLFTNQPYTTDLISSNRKHFRYMKYWHKDRPSGFLNAKKQPLRDVEEIAVFYEKQCVYNPQMTIGRENHSVGKSEGKLTKPSNYNQFKVVNTKGNLKYPRQLMYYPKPHPSLHPTEKPVKLMEDLVKTYSNEGDLILDFTIGIGTTAIACINTNRNYIGFEIKSEHYNLALKRIKDHLMIRH